KPGDPLPRGLRDSRTLRPGHQLCPERPDFCALTGVKPCILPEPPPLANGAPLPGVLVRAVTPGFCGSAPVNLAILPDGPPLTAKPPAGFDVAFFGPAMVDLLLGFAELGELLPVEFLVGLRAFLDAFRLLVEFRLLERFHGLLGHRPGPFTSILPRHPCGRGPCRTPPASPT